MTYRNIFIINKNVYLLLLDSSAAFDTVDQRILLNELQNSYNIKGKALKLITSYLHDRSFSVKIRDVKSTPIQLKYGVPQGSLLGPLFYNIYTKPIEAIVHRHGLNIQSYADDNQIYFTFFNDQKVTVETVLEECLAEIKLWMAKNFLKLNSEKTKVKIFRHKKSLVPNTSPIGDISLQPVRILGVNFTDNLNFSDFINKKVKTCNFHLRNLYNIRSSLSLPNRILLVTNVILSTVDYCNILLLGATDRDIRPLKLVINKSLRFIFNVDFREHITPYYKKAHFLPLKSRILFKACSMSYKIYHGKAPSYFEKDFQKFIPKGTMMLREGSGRDKFMFSTTGGYDNAGRLSTLMIKEWNNLPLDIRKSSSLDIFKVRLKTFFFKKF